MLELEAGAVVFARVRPDSHGDGIASGGSVSPPAGDYVVCGFNCFRFAHWVLRVGGLALPKVLEMGGMPAPRTLLLLDAPQSQPPSVTDEELGRTSCCLTSLDVSVENIGPMSHTALITAARSWFSLSGDANVCAEPC